MMNLDSCRILLDFVYKPHYIHYKEEFGKTIAGFFSDEPELGNGRINSCISRTATGEFYHYILGKLGPSLAAIDEKNQGHAMCEIFDNYGWVEGLRLERCYTVRREPH